MKPAFFHFTWFILLVATQLSDAAPLKLSEEGRRQKIRHGFLFDTFSKNRKTVYRGEGQYRGLKELTILTESREIRDDDEISLPEGAEKIAVFSRHFGFHGEKSRPDQRSPCISVFAE